MRTAVLLLVACAFLAGGCSRLRTSPPTPKPAGPSVEAREIRYNAVLALLYRGSPRVKDEGVWDVLTEMLDEGQQLQSFQTHGGDGPTIPDETGARMTVIGALRAVRELHKKRPEIDLSGLKPSLEKLKESNNATVRTEAGQAVQALFPSP
ncbi:MAG TPA: hypothetical protein VL371_13905 [Gemmataceae bacterium]|jgi:hypothetical protein|nr:hypothetical protein [Gemmataceae bacterium]